MKVDFKLNTISFLFLSALISACQASPVAAPQVTNTIQIPTETSIPTATARPSPTPNAAATERYDELFSQVQEFKDQGYIPSTEGKYVEVKDYLGQFAQLGWLNWSYEKEIILENFVYTATINWSTAVDTSEVSGCGVVFDIQEDTGYYGVILDKSRIYFTSATKSFYYELGKTRGSGRISFGNPAEAKFSLAVFEDHAFVYVDDEFIGEYTLSKDKPLRGKFAYGIISGTNRSFGTRCEIANARIWSLK